MSAFPAAVKAAMSEAEGVGHPVHRVGTFVPTGQPGKNTGGQVRMGYLFQSQSRMRKARSGAGEENLFVSDNGKCALRRLSP